MTTTIEIIRTTKVHGGSLSFYRHLSESTGTVMQFSTYRPRAETKKLLFWLSGLTCNEHNFMVKAHALKFAQQHDLAIICCDTSPRGTNLPNEHAHYDFGSGAGFYLNATQAPWSKHYKMYDYVTKELPIIVTSEYFGFCAPFAISGHSMGGHGAIVLGIHNPKTFCSISAFAPISSPMTCPWGIKAFSNYLGQNKTDWEFYDSRHQIKTSQNKTPILVDQGTSDGYLCEQLQTETLSEAAAENSFPLNLRMQRGYDHSYFFVASFIDEHIAYHRSALDRVAKHF